MLLLTGFFNFLGRLSKSCYLILFGVHLVLFEVLVGLLELLVVRGGLGGPVGHPEGRPAFYRHFHSEQSPS